MIPLLRPDWPTPPQVGAAMSLRQGGCSVTPWQSLNLGVAVGDGSAHVARNRESFTQALGAQPVWLRQVHGREVLRLRHDELARATQGVDAAWTTEKGLACTVLVADCLPVLFAARDGSAVAAAHAGWRGLAAGVLEATLQAMADGAAVAPADIRVWMGPCIGPRQFEVGADVVAAFGQSPQKLDPACFVPRPRADGSAAWLADLQHLARLRLQAAGVSEISAARACTVEDESRFFSFRRDRVTGRMAAAIWLG